MRDPVQKEEKDLRYPPPMLAGKLLRRYKRFLVDVELASGKIVTAHCPNSGSMLGCSTPGAEVFLSQATNPRRKLKYTWELVRVGPTWVGVNTMRTNRIVAEALQAKQVPDLAGFTEISSEVPFGRRSRVDFLLRGAEQDLYLEVKSVTLAADGVACFPDAVTERGRRHLEELMEMCAAGHRAAMLFLIQREDANLFRPAEHIDPNYAEKLRAAHAAGVKILVYDTMITPEDIRLRRKVQWTLRVCK